MTTAAFLVCLALTCAGMILCVGAVLYDWGVLKEGEFSRRLMGSAFIIIILACVVAPFLLHPAVGFLWLVVCIGSAVLTQWREQIQRWWRRNEKKRRETVMLGTTAIVEEYDEPELDIDSDKSIWA